MSAEGWRSGIREDASAQHTACSDGRLPRKQAKQMKHPKRKTTVKESGKLTLSSAATQNVDFAFLISSVATLS